MNRMLVSHTLKMILRCSNTNSINKLALLLLGQDPKLTDPRDVIIQKLYVYFMAQNPKPKFLDESVLFKFDTVTATVIKHSLKGIVGKKIKPNNDRSPYLLDPLSSINYDIIKRPIEIASIARKIGASTINIVLITGKRSIGKTSIIKGLAIDLMSTTFPNLSKYNKIIPVDMFELSTIPLTNISQLQKAFKSIGSASKDAILFFNDFSYIISHKNSHIIAKYILALSKTNPVIISNIQEEDSNFNKDDYSSDIQNQEKFFNVIQNNTEFLQIFPPIGYQLEQIVKQATQKIAHKYNVILDNISIPEVIDLAETLQYNTPQPLVSIELVEDTIINKCIFSKSDMYNYAALTIPMSDLIEVELSEKLYGNTSNFTDTPKNTINMKDLSNFVDSSIFDIEEPNEHIKPKNRETIINLLNSQVIGQPLAKEEMAKTIANLTLFSEKKLPIGQYLFVGPSGVGKTLLAEKIAEVVYGTKHRLLRINLNEYTQEHQSAKLVGSPPGYIGHGEDGQLSKMRHLPVGVLLLDEIEKAHPTIFKYFLSLFEDGNFKDDSGNIISATGWIIIMTSNLGTKEFAKSKVGFDNNHTSDFSVFQKSIDKYFSPEFLGRITSIIPFQPHTKETLIQVAKQQFSKHIKCTIASNYKIVEEKTLWRTIIDAMKPEDYNSGGRYTLSYINKYIKPVIVEAYHNEIMEDINATYIVGFSNLKLVVTKQKPKGGLSNES